MSTWKHKAAALSVGSVLALVLVEFLGPSAGWDTPWSRLLGTDEDQGLSSFTIHEFDSPTASDTGIRDQNDLLEAVFRYQFDHNMINEEAFDVADFVFLGLEGPDGDLVDPPTELMARFNDTPKVVPVFLADTSMVRGVRHKDEEGRCVMFIVEGVRRIDDSAAEVEIRYQGGCGSGNRYRAERKGGEWSVVSGGAFWIS